MCWIKRRKRRRKKVKDRDKKTTGKIERHTEIKQTGRDRKCERQKVRDRQGERERRRKRKEVGVRGERKETLCITFL